MAERGGERCQEERPDRAGSGWEKNLVLRVRLDVGQFDTKIVVGRRRVWVSLAQVSEQVCLNVRGQTMFGTTQSTKSQREYRAHSAKNQRFFADSLAWPTPRRICKTRIILPVQKLTQNGQIKITKILGVSNPADLGTKHIDGSSARKYWRSAVVTFVKVGPELRCVQTRKNARDNLLKFCT